MHLSEWQPENSDRWYLWCDLAELRTLPKLLHITDVSSGEFLVEIKRSLANAVALRLCGVSVDFDEKDSAA